MRLSDGALFRLGPGGRAETFFCGTWVPAGWRNSDLIKPTFMQCVAQSKSNRAVDDESEG